MNTRIFLESRKWLWALLLVNLAGFAFGIWYYVPQLSVTSPLLWVFVIDCPLYVLLFAGVCVLRLKEKAVPRWFYYISAVGLIKYGFWTFLVVVLYWNVLFSSASALYSVLTPLHIGMILEGLVLVPRFRASLMQMLPVLGWFLLNDWLDYFFGTVPLRPPTYLNFLMWESFLVSTGLVFSVFLLGRCRRGE